MLRSRLPITLLAVAAAMWLLAASPAAAITNPAPDNGAHPYVGLVRFEIDGAPAGRCSGTLLSPTVFLTAGHCTVGKSLARVWLEEEVEGNPEYPAGGATSYEGLPYTIPGFCNPCGPSGPEFDYHDVGVVVLTEPVPESVVGSYGRLPEPGLADSLQRAGVDVVGYGAQERLRGGGPPVLFGLRNRFQADADLIPGEFSTSEELLRVSADPGQGHGGTCLGDSGGPTLLDGEATVVGVTAFVNNENCVGNSYAQRIDIPDVLAWVESFLLSTDPAGTFDDVVVGDGGAADGAR